MSFVKLYWLPLFFFSCWLHANVMISVKSNTCYLHQSLLICEETKSVIEAIGVRLLRLITFLVTT